MTSLQDKENLEGIIFDRSFATLENGGYTLVLCDSEEEYKSKMESFDSNSRCIPLYVENGFLTDESSQTLTIVLGTEIMSLIDDYLELEKIEKKTRNLW